MAELVKRSGFVDVNAEQSGFAAEQRSEMGLTKTAVVVVLPMVLQDLEKIMHSIRYTQALKRDALM